MLDKKQIWVIFFSSSKWVVKQRRQLKRSATCLAQELLMNVQGDKSLEDEERSGQP